VTLLLPKGIVGMWDSWRGNARALRAASLAGEAGTEVRVASATSKPARSPARNPGEWSWSDPEPQAAE
ncbi:MAG: urea ABC transporter permease subunit UrtC, partial [Mesorhizobium sp.]